ncbi:MAG: TPR repeat protein [Patiriisocius sp.]|jgi:TPR repeat protein
MLLCLLALCAPSWASFDQAQRAAANGNYREVVIVLTAMLEDEALEPDQKVISYANRGLAYSLLNAYALARRDLQAALSLNPDHPLSLNHMGLLAEQLDKDYVLAASFYQQAVEQRFAASQVNLARLYRIGRGVRKNAQRSFDLYRQAADADYHMAFAPLGRIYTSGEGAPQNLERAFELFQRASESGVITANYHLGVAYEKGRGVKQNIGQAKRNYQIAAVQGHGEAQNALGYLFRRGLGVEQDFIEAANWYQLAVDQGVPDAMNRLAWLLATCPIEKICNGEAAVVLASQAIFYDETPGRLDSLAAGYARLGKFDEAIKTQKRVLQLLPSDSQKRLSYTQRLEQYRLGTWMQL